MLKEYQIHVAERQQSGIAPLPLNANQVAELVELIKQPPAGVAPQDLLELLSQRVPAGVDQAAFVKAAFLADVAKGNTSSSIISPLHAVELLGTMVGGYNIAPLVDLLENDDVGDAAVEALSNTLLVFDVFHDITACAQSNERAQQVLENWAEGTWFTNRPEVPESIRMAVFKVSGEVNTDDLSPAEDAWSRPDIPLHALSMFKKPKPGVPDGALKVLAELKAQYQQVVFVADILGTGSSRKSATNSVLWLTGEDIPHIPNRRGGGYCMGGKIAPIFFNTMEDAGALPIECDVSDMDTGSVIELLPYEGLVRTDDGKDLCTFKMHSDVMLDQVRAGGRIALIVGRGLTARAREHLKKAPTSLFRSVSSGSDSTKGYTLAQKMVGKACGVEGVRPGTYCEPKISTVGSQDTTGPMTRDELKDLACLGFSADLVIQSFCHTAAYPKPVDVETQHTLPDFIINRGGISLRPGDGIIHSWLNRMLMPDGVGTGADSHTRFPLGISFPAGSGLVAFAAALGVMPLDMPESVLVRFKGEMQPGITLRDLVNAIPYAARLKGLLTLDSKGKKNVFSGRCLEVEGLPFLKAEQAFEISDASAERSASGCTINLDKEPILEYLRSNVVLLRWMIAHGYRDARTLERRAQAMEEWIENPKLMRADPDAEYAEIIEIDLNELTEPLLACPNDPDDVRPLSEVQGHEIDEVFIGSCMTNIGHFRAAGKLLQGVKVLNTRLWICPPTRMDEHQLIEEGYYNIFGVAGARTELPGCSLCMGNQARVLAGSTVVSTSTRNFPNRLGDGANVFLASAELSTIAAVLGRLPTPAEYLEFMQDVNTMAPEIYRYLNFNEIEEFQKSAEEARKLDVTNVVQVG